MSKICSSERDRNFKKIIGSESAGPLTVLTPLAGDNKHAALPFEGDISDSISLRYTFCGAEFHVDLDVVVIPRCVQILQIRPQFCQQKRMHIFQFHLIFRKIESSFMSGSKERREVGATVSPFLAVLNHHRQQTALPTFQVQINLKKLRVFSPTNLCAEQICHLNKGLKIRCSRDPAHSAQIC